jgi:hypothetical protein
MKVMRTQFHGHPAATKASLSPNRRRLLELMQQLNFGQLRSLIIRGGDPVFDPPPHVVREVKFGRENGARPEEKLADFLLKSQVVELLHEFDRLQNGTIDIEVKHGLPFRMIVTEAAA